MDKAAVQLVIVSCRGKFPEAAAPPLSDDQVRLLTGRAAVSPGTAYYRGTLYNGNDNVNVMEVEILVATTIGGQRVENTYRSDVSAERKGTGTLGFAIVAGDEGAEYEWSIRRAWGWPVP